MVHGLRSSGNQDPPPSVTEPRAKQPSPPTQAQTIRPLHMSTVFSVQQAISIILNPSSTNAHRSSAHQYTESIKGDHANAVQTAIELLLLPRSQDRSTDLSVKNFGILMLMEWQRVAYEQIANGRASGIAPSLGPALWPMLGNIMLAAGGSSSSSSASSPTMAATTGAVTSPSTSPTQQSDLLLIRDKLAHVLADACLWEWPHHWPNVSLGTMLKDPFMSLLLTRFVSVVYGDEPFPYLVSSSTGTQDGFLQKRQLELRAVFERDLLIPSLEFLVPSLILSPNDDILLAMFCAFVPWAPFPGASLLEIERVMLANAHFDVVLAIAQAASQKQEPPAHVAWLFSSEAMQVYQDFVSRALGEINAPITGRGGSASQSQSLVYDQFGNLLDLLCYLGSNVLSKTRSEGFLSLMLALTQCHLPLLLRSNLCLFWVSVTKGSGELFPLLPVQPLIQAIIEGQVRESFTGHPLNQHDFSSGDDEYTEFATATKSRYGDVVAGLASHEQCFQALLSIIGSFLGNPKASEGPMFLRQWTMLCFFVEYALRGIPQASASKNFLSVDLLSGLLGLEFDENPRMLTPLLQCVKAACQTVTLAHKARS